LREVEATKQPPQQPKLSPEELERLTFFELRDKLLAADALDWEHVKKVNEAEALFWQKREGTRVAWSHEILQFDCGGQQWVLEAAFPAGTVNKPSPASMEFMEDALALVEREKIAAPAPIEQRWSRKSDSPMSPGYAPPGAPRDSIHSWVGIIMYLPTEELVERERIRSAFEDYKKKCEVGVWARFGAVEHWAKVEVPDDRGDRILMQERFRSKYPLDEYNQARWELDPKNLLGNRLLNFISGVEKVRVSACPSLAGDWYFLRVNQSMHTI
jgi:L-galactono-1,4-lactone dehydrogenase